MEQSGQLVRPITSRSRGSNPVPAINLKYANRMAKTFVRNLSKKEK